MDPVYASIVTYTSLSAYYILHMIFVIGGDFVDAFNIPPLNIGIYVGKLVSLIDLLMVLADILEWAITQQLLQDPGPYKKLIDGSDFSARRIGSVLSFFVMIGCRIGYLVLLYTSDNKSLPVFIVLCIEGFWFGVFQMSFFAIGPEFSAFTSLGIHTMGWIYFCLQYIKGDTPQYKALVDEPFWFETGSFNDLVEALKTKLESQPSLDANGVVNKIKEALQNGSVCPKIKSLVNQDFGITSQGIDVENITGDTTGVKVTIGGGGTSEGTAKVKVTRSGSEGTITIEVKGNGLTEEKAKKIAKRLAKAVEIAAFQVTKLKSFKVVSTSETADEVVKFLAQKLRDAGSPQFRALVNALKGKAGFSSGNLDATKLQKALNNDGVVRTNIIRLLQAEFSLIGLYSPSQIGATVQTGNKVTVKISGGGNETGSAVVKQNQVKGIQQDITIEVNLNKSLVSGDSEKPSKVASRLVRAVETAKFNISENLVEALVKAEFGFENATVEADISHKVTVNIGNSGGTSEGTASVKVKKEGQPEEGTITIEVKSKNENDISKPAARRVGRRLAKILKQNNNKFNSVRISMEEIATSNVLSPLLLFPIGSAVKDFLYPAILPFAFLDETTNLFNYCIPFFFFTAFIILLINDFFSGEQSILGTGMKALDSQFKEWSEGEAHPWHALWAGNIPIYIAFFIMIWSIHGTFPRLRCIVQSRWRIMLLTMFIIIPRSILEVAGYVGVANFAIAQGETGDYSGFDFIVFHDVLAMFCRFFNDKLAVGYNLIRISVGYCLPEFKPRQKGLGFGFWCARTILGAWSDIVKDFKADIKDYL